MTDLSYVDDGAFQHEIPDNSKAIYDMQTITAIVARAFTPMLFYLIARKVSLSG